MISKLRLSVFCSLIAFLICTGNAKAEINTPVYDSTCCPPDSLQFVSANYPTFCVRWQIPAGDSCKTPIGFEIEWKLLSGSVWKHKAVTYTSGTIINFCDSADGCGTHQWRVRTICHDSSYSAWVFGNKFNVPCGEGKFKAPELSITPNPAGDKVTIHTNLVKPLSVMSDKLTATMVQVSVVNTAGNKVFDKKIRNAEDGQLRQEISVSDWQKGTYFVIIMVNGVVINRGTFIKE